MFDRGVSTAAIAPHGTSGRSRSGVPHSDARAGHRLVAQGRTSAAPRAGARCARPGRRARSAAMCEQGPAGHGPLPGSFRPCPRRIRRYRTRAIGRPVRDRHRGPVALTAAGSRTCPEAAARAGYPVTTRQDHAPAAAASEPSGLTGALGSWPGKRLDISIRTRMRAQPCSRTTGRPPWPAGDRTGVMPG
jgi:hypothetical protein